ncbi:hypothetical protein FRC04_003009 [Tulasnella sp. 424]|nr:hypothetical protein FRC04_003009 [Tulasnella sp. 424]
MYINVGLEFAGPGGPMQSMARKIAENFQGTFTMPIIRKIGPVLAALGSLSMGQAPAEQSLSGTAGASLSPLVNFQVAQPLTFPSNLKKCTVEVVRHNFGNSYYQPAIAEWKPPKDCGNPLDWAGVSGNYTATSNGTQYDRLSAITFQNVEIWRTSTAEPSPSGIIWTAVKDLSHYLPLFLTPGRVILDLNNIVDPDHGLDGEYDGGITVYASLEKEGVARSNGIIALGTLSPDQAGYGGVPPMLNTTVNLPRNTAEAYAEIYASGNAQEEFWYFNAPDSWIPALPKDTTLGKGPFREVQLLVDGKLAGIVSPYPILFTGANVPLIWRPAAAYGAFDQPTYKVDLTPFIPILADGNNHTITIDVVSAEPDHTILGNWWVSGNIQVILDPSNQPTKGVITKYVAPVHATSRIAGNKDKKSGDVSITVAAEHSLQIEALLVTGSGTISVVTWQQSYSFTNTQSYRDGATYQVSRQGAQGQSRSTHNGVLKLEDEFSWPLTVDFWTVDNDEGFGWGTVFDHGYDRSEILPPFMGANTIISYHRRSEGSRFKPKDGARINTAASNLTFSYGNDKDHTYWRTLKTDNGSVTRDEQGGTLANAHLQPWSFMQAGTDVESEGVARLHGSRYH